MRKTVDRTEYETCPITLLQELANPRFRDANALFELSQHYLEGRGVPKDMSKHYALLGLAAELGQPQAQYRVYYASEYGGANAKALSARSVQGYLENAAMAGHPSAQLVLARVQRIGKYESRNIDKAVALYCSVIANPNSEDQQKGMAYYDLSLCRRWRGGDPGQKKTSIFNYMIKSLDMSGVAPSGSGNAVAKEMVEHVAIGMLRYAEGVEKGQIPPPNAEQHARLTADVQQIRRILLAEQVVDKVKPEVLLQQRSWIDRLVDGITGRSSVIETPLPKVAILPDMIRVGTELLSNREMLFATTNSFTIYRAVRSSFGGLAKVMWGGNNLACGS